MRVTYEGVSKQNYVSNGITSYDSGLEGCVFTPDGIVYVCAWKDGMATLQIVLDGYCHQHTIQTRKPLTRRGLATVARRFARQIKDTP